MGAPAFLVEVVTRPESSAASSGRIAPPVGGGAAPWAVEQVARLLVRFLSSVNGAVVLEAARGLFRLSETATEQGQGTTPPSLF